MAVKNNPNRRGKFFEKMGGETMMGGVVVWCEWNSGSYIVNVSFDGNLRKIRTPDRRQAMKLADNLTNYGKLRYNVA